MPFGNAPGQGFNSSDIFDELIVDGSGGGILVYNNTSRALGTLIASLKTLTGTDAEGNAWLQGFALYTPAASSPAYAVALNGTQIQWWESAAGSGGPWTAQAEMLWDSSTHKLDLNNFAGITDTLQTPQAAPAITGLGSTWNATTASECNTNFNNIIAALQNAQIIS